MRLIFEACECQVLREDLLGQGTDKSEMRRRESAEIDQTSQYEQKRLCVVEELVWGDL